MWRFCFGHPWCRHAMTSMWRDSMLEGLCNVPMLFNWTNTLFWCEGLHLKWQYELGFEMPIVFVMIKRHVWDELWLWPRWLIWIVGWFWFLWGKTSNLLQYWKIAQNWSMGMVRKLSFTSSTLNVKGWHDVERGVRANKIGLEVYVKALKRGEQESGRTLYLGLTLEW